MKQKIMAVFCAAFATAAFGDHQTVDGIRWHYTLSGSGATVFGSSRSVWDADDRKYETEYTPAIPVATSGAVTIPATLGGKSVTAIGPGAFDDCDRITAVEIPSTVVSIGEEAFSGCERLASIEIPANVATIGYKAFEGCDKLRKARVPETLKSQVTANLVFWETPVSITYYTAGGGATPEPEPEPEPRPAPSGAAGTLDTAFSKTQTVQGTLLDEYGNVAGTVQLKATKRSRRGSLKISATATLINGKKVSAKAETVAPAANGTIACELEFKDPVDDMDFYMAADGAFSLAGDDYSMAASKIGALANGNAKVTLSGTGIVSPAGVIDELLPAAQEFEIVNGKWRFAKAASVKLARAAKGEEPRLVVSTDNGKTNLSGLKLTFKATTGIFKGSFKAYVLDTSGAKAKLKKINVSVSGVVVDGKGVGLATCKAPASGIWKCEITNM